MHIWHSKQFYWKEKDTSKDNNRAGYPEFISSTGYGTGEGLGGYNCRHTYYPFFPYSSTPAYTDKELKALAEETRAYQDKEYTVYEANQKLRAYERAIRKSKRKLVGYEALGDDEAFLLESVRHRLINDEYKAFARGVDLPIKVARTQEVGYKRGMSERSSSFSYWVLSEGKADKLTTNLSLYQKQVDKHLYKIKKPHLFYENWDEFSDREKGGYIHHRKKEIKPLGRI